MSKVAMKEVTIAPSMSVAAGTSQPATDAGSLMTVIARAASDPSIDIDKMERLIALRDRIIASEKEQSFNDAMSRAQGEMRRVAVDKRNDQTRSKYASYAAIDRVIRPIYTANGFGLSFNTEPGPESYVRIVCHVTGHGHTRKYQVDMPADGKGAKGGDVMTKTHAVGSAMTYGQRYLLKMIFNIAIGEDDDDGNGGPQNDETITDEQCDELNKLLIETKSDLVKFLKHIKLESLTQIRASKFEDAKNLIKATAARRREIAR